MKQVNKEIIKDVKSEIRKYKISNLLEKSKKLEFDINNLCWERKELIKHFSQYGAITGSTLYVLHGLINRFPTDTDLIVDVEGLEKLKELYEIKKGDFYTFHLINHIGYIPFKINKNTYNVDIILVEDLSYTKIIDNIRIDDVFKSIKMKLDMYENSEKRDTFKDEMDLDQIASTLKKKMSYSERIQKELNSLDLADKPFLNKIKDFLNKKEL